MRYRTFTFTPWRRLKPHKVKKKPLLCSFLHLGDDSAVTFAAVWKCHQSCEQSLLSVTVLDRLLLFWLNIHIYGYSFQRLMTVIARNIWVCLWFILVLSSLPSCCSGASERRRQHRQPRGLLAFPTTSSHPVPRRGDTEFLCPAELSGSATKSSFTTKSCRHSLPAKREVQSVERNTRAVGRHTWTRYKTLHIQTWISVF